MAIQPKPKSNTSNKQAVEKFVEGAQSSTNTVLVKKPKKILVSLRFDSHILEAIDNAANHRGMSRNAIISYWCSRALDAE